MSTARTLITNALKTCGAIAPIETPSDQEIDHGLNELNLIIDSLSQDNLFLFENKRKVDTFPANKSNVTIGIGNGIQILSIVDDGAVIDITTKKVNTFYAGNEVTIVDTENYDIENATVIYQTDRSIKLATRNVVTSLENIASVVPEFGVGLTQVICYAAPVNIQLNDNVIVTDNNNYSLTGIVTSIDGVTISIEGEFFGDTSVQYMSGSIYLYSSRIATPSERYGYSYLSSDPIPDIISNRPYEIDNIQILFDSYNNRLCGYTADEWDSRAFNTNMTAEPRSYTYYTYYPFGEIQLNCKSAAEYNVVIIYKNLIDNYDLDDELVLPPGYESTLQYILAGVLSPQYGIQNDRIIAEAQNRKAQLMRRNFKPSVMRCDGIGSYSYDYYSDRYI